MMNLPGKSKDRLSETNNVKAGLVTWQFVKNEKLHAVEFTKEN